MIVLETARLSLSHLNEQDAPFMLELLNTPSWLRFIGDRKIRTEEQAAGYIKNIIAAAYAKDGFGFYLVTDKQNKLPVGICGLVKREALPHVDIGFAFLPEHERKGYGHESAAAVMNYARGTLGIKKLVAICNDDNFRSIHLLEKLGFRFERMIEMNGEKLVLMETH